MLRNEGCPDNVSFTVHGSVIKKKEIINKA